MDQAARVCGQEKGQAGLGVELLAGGAQGTRLTLKCGLRASSVPGTSAALRLSMSTAEAETVPGFREGRAQISTKALTATHESNTFEALFRNKLQNVRAGLLVVGKGVSKTQGV